MYSSEAGSSREGRNQRFSQRPENYWENNYRNHRSGNNNNQFGGFDNRKTKIRKDSGKSSGYMRWLTSEGRKTFENTYRVSFNNLDHDHQAKMGEFWNALDNEVKAEYKREAREINSNPTFIQDRRRRMNSDRRRRLHENPTGHINQMYNHRNDLKRHQEASRKFFGMANLPKKETQWSKCPYSIEQIKLKRKDDRDQLEKVLQFRSRNGVVNPLMEESTLFQIISVFPITFVYQVNHKAIFTYPAEISLTTFSLKTGHIETETVQVKFDQDSFYNGNANSGNPEYVRDSNTRKQYSESLGVPESGPVDGLDPEEAFQWVIGKLINSPCILCDLKQYTWVLYGLRTLAMLTGLQAQSQFQDFVCRFVTIQDFVSTVLNKIPLEVPEDEKWSEADIENQFLNNYLWPENGFCDFHEKLPESQLSCQYQCCKAHNLRLLHTAFEIFDEHMLTEFCRKRNVSFLLCTERDEAIANLPMAPTIEDKEAESDAIDTSMPSTSTESAGPSSSSISTNRTTVRYGDPSEGLHPLFTNNQRNLDIQYCRECLILWEDSDEDETFENYLSSRETPRNVSRGFPSIDFRRESSQANYYVDDERDAARDNFASNSYQAPPTMATREMPVLEESEYLYPIRNMTPPKIECLLSPEQSRRVYNLKAEMDFKNWKYNGLHQAVRERVGG